MSMILKTYSVTVQGFSPHTFFAATPGRARVRAWHSYSSGYPCSFKEFMSISSCRRADDPPGLGRKITVGGKPAYSVPTEHGHPEYVFPDTDVILNTHPLDLEEGWPNGSVQKEGNET